MDVKSGIVSIENFNNKITVKSKFDRKLVEIIRQMTDKRFWDVENHEWVLPGEILESFTEALDKAGIKYVVTNRKIQALCNKISDQYEMKFDHFVRALDMKSVENLKYNRENQKFMFPSSEKEKIFKLLKEYEIEVHCKSDSEDEKPAKKTRLSTFKPDVEKQLKKGQGRQASNEND